MQKILIEGDEVSVIQQEVIKKIHLKDFQTSLTPFVGMETPILPDGTIFYKTKEQSNIFVLQDPPMKRTLTFRVGDDENEITLPLPWVCYVLSFRQHALREFQLFFRNGPITDMGDSVFRSPLSNIEDSYVCLGKLQFDVGRSDPDTVRILKRGFWAGNFNQDLWGMAYEKLPREILDRNEDGSRAVWRNYWASLEKWRELSLEDACKTNWVLPVTLDRVIRDTRV